MALMYQYKYARAEGLCADMGTVTRVCLSTNGSCHNAIATGRGQSRLVDANAQRADAGFRADAGLQHPLRKPAKNTDVSIAEQVVKYNYQSDAIMHPLVG